MAKKDTPVLHVDVDRWMNDPAIRRSTPSARAFWIDLKCMMMRCEEIGVLSSGGVAWSNDEIARSVPGDSTLNLQCLMELERNGVAHRTKSGAVFCLELVQKNHITTVRSIAGASGWKKKCTKDICSSKVEAKPQANRQAKPQQTVKQNHNELTAQEVAAPIPNNGATPCSSINNSDDFQLSTDPPKQRIVMSFVLTGKSDPSWDLNESKFQQYKETFPHLDLLQELRTARQWLLDNPAKRKTASGMPRFLTYWLSNAQNKNLAQRGGSSPQNGNKHQPYRTTEQRSQLAALGDRAVEVEPDSGGPAEDQPETQIGDGPGIPY